MYKIVRSCWVFIRQLSSIILILFFYIDDNFFDNFLTIFDSSHLKAAIPSDSKFLLLSSVHKISAGNQAQTMIYVL